MRFPRSIPARPALRRSLACLAAAAALAIPAGLTPLPVAAATAAGCPPGASLIRLVSFSSWTETPFPGSPDFVHIVGQVQNCTGASATQVKVNVVLFDNSLVPVQIETQFTWATVNVLGQGEYSPFELQLSPPPPSYGSYVIGTISSTPSTAHPYHAPLTVKVTSCPNLPADWVCGTVTNATVQAGGVAVDQVRAILTYVDSNGNMAQEHPMVDGPSLAAGATGTFQFALTPGEPIGTGIPIAIAEPAYPVDLNPASLDFGKQLVNTTSASKSFTVANIGARALSNLNVPSVAGDFSAFSDCPSNLLAGYSCTVTVTFRPSARGTQATSLSITSDGAGSPNSIALTGQGVAPVVSLVASGGSDFGPVDIGKASPLKAFTLTNAGDWPLTVSDIQISGDYFVQSKQPCLGTIDPTINPSCVLKVMFVPRVAGTRNGALTLSDNAPDSPQSLALTGTGLGSAVSFNPSSLNFGDQNVAVTTLSATVLNSGTVTLHFTAVAADAPFTASGCVPTALSPGQTCIVTVTFHAEQLNGPGAVAGLMTLTDSAGKHYSLPLTGNPAAARGPTQSSGKGRTGPPPPPPPKI